MTDRWRGRWQIDGGGGGGGVDGWGVDGRSMAVLWGIDGRSIGGRWPIDGARQRDLPDTTVYKTRTDSISIPGAFLVAQVKLHLVKLHLFTLWVKLHLLALLVKLQTQNLK